MLTAIAVYIKVFTSKSDKREAFMPLETVNSHKKPTLCMVIITRGRFPQSQIMYLDITTANWTLANNYRASNFAKTATSAKQNKPLFVFLSMLCSKYAIKMGLLLIFFTENSAAQAHSCSICVVLLTEKLGNYFAPCSPRKTWTNLWRRQIMLGVSRASSDA